MFVMLLNFSVMGVAFEEETIDDCIED